MEFVNIKISSGNVQVAIKRKKIKNVHLKVFRDLTTVLSVPDYTPYEWAENYIKSKSKWIDKQIDKYKKSSGYNNLTWVKSGSSTQMLGKDMRIIKKASSENRINVDEKTIIVELKDIKNEKKANGLFEQWWRTKAYEVYFSIVKGLMPIFRRHRIRDPQIKIRKMKTLWGSCSKQLNKLTFNEYLLKADLRCIEYVVLHEMTHLVHYNHNKDFYNFLTIYMPDWKERKEQLDTEVVQGL